MVNSNVFLDWQFSEDKQGIFLCINKIISVKFNAMQRMGDLMKKIWILVISISVLFVLSLTMAVISGYNSLVDLDE
jgi:hypothetical protein